MISCVKCGNELPDGALHCVFCGAKQAVGSQVPPPAAGEDRTVMHRGRAAASAPPAQYPPAGAAPGPARPVVPSDEDIAGAKTIGVGGELVRQMLDNLPEPPPAAPPAGAGPQPGYPPGAGPGAPPPGAYPPAAGPPPGVFGAPPPAAPPPGAGPWNAPPAGGFGPQGYPPPAYPPAGMGGPGQPPWGMPGPGAPPPSPFEAPASAQAQRNRFAPPAADEMATVVAQARAVGTPPAAAAGMPTMMPPGMPPGIPHGPPTLPPGMQPLVPETPLGPKTVALSPEQAAGHFRQHTPPPFLASQTLGRMGAPQEPWAGLLSTLLLVFGIGLIAVFVLPWRIGEQVAFSWTTIAHGPGATKLGPLLIGITGVLGVVFGLLPLGTAQRGIAAAAAAGVALMLQSLVVAGFSAAGLFGFLTALTLISGLLLRSEYQTALLPRVLTTAGVVFFLLSLVIPSGGQVPLVAHVEAVGGMPGRMKIVAVLQLFWDVAPLLGLLCWLPAPGAAGTKILAWLLIVQPVVMALFTGVLTPYEGGLGAGIMGRVYEIFLAPVVAMAWTALLGYGVATVMGKQLEHP